MPISTYKSRAVARQLRRRMTKSEQRLWSRLRQRQLGVRFRPQVPRGDYVLDFFCRALGLAVEVDGKIHEHQQEYDANRTNRLIGEFAVRRMIRVSNEDVMQDIESVIRRISAAVEDLSKELPPITRKRRRQTEK